MTRQHARPNAWQRWRIRRSLRHWQEVPLVDYPTGDDLPRGLPWRPRVEWPLIVSTASWPEDPA
jgi:hypothetical protein